jgi:F-type H+-transporting ATPase subunit b
MELIQPGIGLIFWMTLSFAIVLFILGKYAWRPIMKGLKNREESIRDALTAADKARDEMDKLKVDNEKLIRQAKEDRDAILAEARKVKEKLIDDAKEKANEEANRIVENARERIENEKRAALFELKNEIAKLSLEIAETVLRGELKDRKRQEALIKKLVDDIKVN